MMIPSNQKIAPLSDVEGRLRDELYCIADSKLVLAGWYMIVLPNGRAISDWSSMCAMMQAQYGHARALYQYLGRFGVTREEAEWNRGAKEIRSPKLLNRPPTSWSNFVMTMFLAEQAILTQLDAYRLGVADRTLARLADKVHKESRFHRSYAVGWIKALKQDPDSRLLEEFDDRFAEALDWWGGDDKQDLLFKSGFRNAAEGTLRQRFIDSVTEVLDVGKITNPPLALTWKREIRRDGEGGLPNNLFEILRFKNIELALP